jgi:hypothetical protein
MGTPSLSDEGDYARRALLLMLQKDQPLQSISVDGSKIVSAHLSGEYVHQPAHCDCRRGQPLPCGVAARVLVTITMAVHQMPIGLFAGLIGE